jgi:hypothetical protein
MSKEVESEQQNANYVEEEIGWFGARALNTEEQFLATCERALSYGWHGIAG